MGRTQIPDAHWRVMWQIIRNSPRIWKSDEARERAFVEQIGWAVRTGVPWAEIPTRLGRALRRRFERWQRHGVWAALFEASIPSAPAEGTVMVDSTTLKAHRVASGARGSRGDPAAQMLGRSRGGLCTKLHAVTDAAGRFLALCLSPGQAGDAPRFLPLLCEALGRCQGVRAALADRAYSSRQNRAGCKALGIEAVIPPRANEKEQAAYDRETYKLRHAIENAFAPLKDAKRIALRCDKKAAAFLGTIHLVACLHNLRTTARIGGLEELLNFGHRP
jgi:transposase